SPSCSTAHTGAAGGCEVEPDAAAAACAASNSFTAL
ncbi:hypothetical protein A2U01_0085622, partial [Trifolium medium]|nr:hypothetical protein [Trifolium medium]